MLLFYSLLIITAEGHNFDWSWFEGVILINNKHWHSTFEEKQSLLHDIQLQEYSLACNQSRACCQNKKRHKQIDCILKCVSPKCYFEHYSVSAVELGEIDLSFNRYLNCLHKKLAINCLD
jgi:hypothetical protein